MITLSERIKLELRNRDPIEITELILDNSKATDIEGISDEYRNLRQLSLVNVGLISLKNFPALPNLEKLDLSDNRISCGLEYLKSCPKINQLFLTNNKLRSLNEIKPLSHLQLLETLDVSNCELSETYNYRRKVFEMIPTLKHLDGYLEFEDSGDYESDTEDSENDNYTNVYDSDELDDDENTENIGAKNKHMAGKRGKCRSKVKYFNQENDSDDQLATTDFYPDDYQKVEQDHYETPNINLLFDYNDIYESESDDNDHAPPSHGSKFAPTKIKTDEHQSLKRSYCYGDDYSSSSKLYCQFGDSYSPVETGLD